MNPETSWMIAFGVLLVAFVLLAATNQNVMKLNQKLIEDNDYLCLCLDTADILFASSARRGSCNSSQESNT